MQQRRVADQRHDLGEDFTNSGGANVTGGFLVLDYSASGVSVANMVQSVLQTAFSHGFTNTADHIYDTSASNSIGLGWVDNTTTKQVTIMPALYGDANLNGQVTGQDLIKLLANYNGSGTLYLEPGRLQLRRQGDRSGPH